MKKETLKNLKNAQELIGIVSNEFGVRTKETAEIHNELIKTMDRIRNVYALIEINNKYEDRIKENV